MNINDEIKYLRERKKEISYEKDYLKEKKENELKNLKKLIEEKYNENMSDLLKDENNLNNEIKNFYKQIDKNSEFGFYFKYILTDLVSIFEGEDYLYGDTFCFIDRKNLNEIKDIEIIISKRYKELKDKKQRNSIYFYKEHIDSLIKHGKVLIVSRNKDTNTFKFYKYNENRNTLEQTIKYGKFTYVKDFIDYLISYKIEENKDLNYEDIVKLEYQFIKENKDYILEKYNNLKKEKEHCLKKELDNEDHKRIKKLEKRLNTQNNE